MFWKFFDPGFLKRCKGEFVKSFVRLFSYKQKMTNVLLKLDTFNDLQIRQNKKKNNKQK